MELLPAACTVGSLVGFNSDKVRVNVQHPYTVDQSQALQVRFVCLSLKPSLEVSETHITVGRATVPVISRTIRVMERSPPHSHALTRHFLVLLERLAVCVQHGESVLLVGETGTGKTSAVQHLARLSGKIVCCILSYWRMIPLEDGAGNALLIGSTVFYFILPNI